MTFRTEIRGALDVVVPGVPPAGLSQRVIRTAAAEVSRSQIKHHWTIRVRAPLSVAAAVVLISLVAGMLIGGRLMRDWNGLHNAQPAGQLTLAELEATPLKLPAVASPAACPNHPGSNALGYDYGSGPIYVNGKLIPEVKFVGRDGTGGGLYTLTYYSAPSLKGLVLVRGQDLVNDRPIQFIPPQGAGYPSDTPPWPARNELVIDAANPPARTAGTGFGYWHVGQVIDDGWSGCWGFQIDGSGFSETITGFVQPY